MFGFYIGGLGTAAQAPGGCEANVDAGGEEGGESRESGEEAAAAAGTGEGDGVTIQGPGQKADGRQGWLEVLQLVAGQLPADKPRMVAGLDTPAEILAAVAAGIDLFDQGFVPRISMEGFALRFAYDAQQAQRAGQQGGASASAAAAALGVGGGEDAAGGGPAGLWMDLHDGRYAEDGLPLVPGCGCFTCRSHTRAYLHHLLNTKELLAGVLLEAHNAHHYLGFFAAIRAAIAAGQFEEYREWVLGHASGDLPR